MSTSMSPYKLIFEGPRDDSPETLRQIKGVFIAELQCSIDEVKQYLDDAPTEILASEQEEEILKVIKLLEEAGATVSMVGEDSQEDDEEEIEFTFDIEEIEQDKPEVKKEPKVYTLDFDPEEEKGEPNTGLQITTEEEEETVEALDEPTIDEPLVDQPLVDEPSIDELSEATNDSLSLSFDDGEDEIEESVEEEQIPEEAESEPDNDFDLTFSTDEDEEFENTESHNPPPTLEAPAEEIDLSFSFDDTEEEALVEPDVIDPNIAGDLETNWDLSFDGEQQESEDNDEEIDLAAAEPEVEEEEEEIIEEDQIEAAPEEIVQEEEVSEAVEEEHVAAEDEEEPKLSTLQNESSLSEEVEVTEEEPKENDEETTEIVAESSPKKGRSGKKDNNSAILILVGAIVLFLVNGYFIWINFLSGPTQSVSDSTLDSMIRAAKNRKASTSSNVATIQKNAAPFIKISNSKETKYGEIQWEIVTRGSSVLSANIEFKAKKPRELSKLEIATNKLPNPWLHKAEMVGMKFSPDENGNYKGSTTARFFIEQGDRHRSVGHGSLIVAYNEKEDLIAGTLILSTTPAKATGKQHYKLSGSQKDGFTLSTEIEFVSSGGAPKEPKEK